MKKCILMVGIHDPLLESLSGLINTFGYQVLPTFSINIASWLVAQRRFALVIVNTEYFQMGLFEFLAKVRQHQQSPVAALSGSILPDIQEWSYDVDLTMSIQSDPQKMISDFMALIKSD